MSDRYRHKKRGGTYTLVSADARFQFSGARHIENELEKIDLAVYQDEDSGKMYVRPTFEFEDGRFEKCGPRASLDETFETIQAEDRARELRLLARQVRKFLAGALCAGCGNPLGEDREVVMNDDGETTHKGCEAPPSVIVARAAEEADKDDDLPKHSDPGRVLFRWYRDPGYSRTDWFVWSVEVSDYDVGSSLFWMSEGVGIEYQLEGQLELEQEGYYVAEGVTGHVWRDRDGETNEEWYIDRVRYATQDEIEAEALA